MPTRWRCSCASRRWAVHSKARSPCRTRRRRRPAASRCPAPARSAMATAARASRSSRKGLARRAWRFRAAAESGDWSPASARGSLAVAPSIWSGEFQLGGSASLLTVGLADTRGVKVTYLFNLFDYWGTVVTSRPEIKTLRDLEGKDLAAAKGTTNYVMFDWFARQQGADTAKFSVINTATPGLIGYAVADRAAAGPIWEPAYTTLLSKKSDMRTIDIGIAESWRKFTGSRNIPYLGVAAHIDWVEKNPKLVAKLYAAYKEASEWVTAHPEEASNMIAPKGTPDDQKAITELIRANDRLGMSVHWASDLAQAISSVYPAVRSSGFLPA